MATFGKTTIGGSSGGSSGNLIRGSKYTLAAPGGKVTKISWYGDRQTTDAKMKCGIYAKGTGGQPGALLVSSAEVTINSSTAQWWDFTVSPGVTLSADDYWIAFDYDNNSLDVFYDNVNNEATKDFTYTGTLPDPYPASAFSTTKEYSIYATYTPTVTDTGFMTFFND